MAMTHDNGHTLQKRQQLSRHCLIILTSAVNVRCTSGKNAMVEKSGDFLPPDQSIDPPLGLEKAVRCFKIKHLEMNTFQM
jgi:hypothetical protein